MRVVHVGHVQEADKRVVVDKVVETASAAAERGNDPPLIFLLLGVGNDPALDQGQDSVREHLRMDTQVPVRGQAGEHRVRDGADAHLQGGPVGDQVLGNQLPDGGLGGGRGQSRVFRDVYVFPGAREGERIQGGGSLSVRKLAEDWHDLLRGLDM